jgi:hypothetical protein
VASRWTAQDADFARVNLCVGGHLGSSGSAHRLTRITLCAFAHQVNGQMQ